MAGGIIYGLNASFSVVKRATTETATLVTSLLPRGQFWPTCYVSHYSFQKERPRLIAADIFCMFMMQTRNFI
ncbi:hypothetical protein AD945_01175 [Gluconobacter albidus]|uniref:Uncharacterized protein n=1 Tax=Gluconobacter albidus TaxID=318683 RepID=A0A149TN49_9PROT|nr:hypothetical protein AD945_01175 [Gluconobacter albidus]